MVDQKVSATMSVEMYAVYSLSDVELWEELQNHLQRLLQENVISNLYDRAVPEGSWNGQIDKRLDRSNIILVLLSPDLVATGYCTGNELARAVKRNQQRDALIIPIVLRPVDFSDIDLDKVEVLPSDSQPVDRWPSCADAFADIAAGIVRVVEQFRQIGTVDFAEETAPPEPQPPSSQSRSSGSSSSSHVPEQIDRYVFERRLGKGAFGSVYLAFDVELERKVAVKVPHRDRIKRPEDVEKYLAEARVVAKLDHPNIVPVFDFNRTAEGLCYVVSKFVDGSDLHALIKKEAPDYLRSARLVAQIADALAHAHHHNVIHRDVKPANILVDTAGTPFLADFGLAIKEEDFGKGSKYAGTPAYMSPEQARGEGHRLDGRSDTFSLGVVLYELLSSKRPFRSKSISGLLQEISSTEARPPREIDAEIPRELERICLKAMANRTRDRYSTGKDFGEDLWHFLGESNRISDSAEPSSRRSRSTTSSEAPESAGIGTNRNTHGSTVRERQQPVSNKVVPKGLRAFDVEDAEFFLQLLPGPRDRNGVPDSIRFWHGWTEAKGPSNSVGLIYGPSGCGKSSFVQAGLLPKLSSSIVTVSVKATGAGTEERLGQQLLNRCPSLPGSLELTDVIQSIRRGHAIPSDKSMLIVIDQFEQWLQEYGDDPHAELTQALRQCDGDRVKCLLLVRDDYVMGIHRFMNHLEVPIQEHTNAATVDLFDQAHARKVLTEFGKAFGRLPEEGKPDRQQDEFVARAIADLSNDDNQVVPIHLAIFTEMVKGRDWSNKTLEELGGAKGIGIKFLEDTFGSQKGPLELRPFQSAATILLKELLPAPGSNIRGQAKSVRELRSACDYADRQTDFENLLTILDRDLRFITPTVLDEESTPDSVEGTSRHYQLTHDFFVPLLREYLSRKQKETMRGRAELRLEQRAAIWNETRQRRHLPSLLEFINIRLLTSSANWNQSQKQMMGKATPHHLMRTGIAASVLIIAILTLNFGLKRIHAKGLVDNLKTANLAEVPAVQKQIERYRSWVEPALLDVLDNPNATETETLNAQIVMLGSENGDAHVDPIFDHMLQKSEPDELPILREVLFIKKDKKTEELWSILTQPENHPTFERIRAAAALAKYDPESAKWDDQVLGDVATQLVSVPPSFLGQWEENLESIGDKLRNPLQKIYRDENRSEEERTTSASLLARFTPDKPKAWSNLLVDAINLKQFELFFGKLEKQASDGVVELDRRLAALLRESDDLRNRFESDVQDLEMRHNKWQGDGLKLQADFKTFLETTPDADKEPFLATDRNLIAKGKRLIDERSTELPRLQHNNRQRDTLARQSSNIAVALLRLAQGSKVWPLLKQSPDTRLRSFLIHRFAPLDVPPSVILDHLESLDQKTDADSLAIRQALILSLGEYKENQLAAAGFANRIPTAIAILRRWYQQESDRGIHGAAHWLLQKWGEGKWLQDANENLKSNTVPAGRQWFVNSQGQTMVIMPRNENGFLAGSPFTEEGRERGLTSDLDTWEKRHRRKIDRRYAMSTTEVTVEQFRRFKKDHVFAEDVSPEDNCPINYTKWIDAVQYCNWLSTHEGLPEDEFCYLLEVHEQNGTIQTNISMPKDYLTRKGYRLPTDSEWEYATRAGSVTRRHYGETDRLLGKYAWYFDNTQGIRTQAVGQLKPNAWGLFDVYGNVSEWCHDYREDFTYRIQQDPDTEQPTLTVNPMVTRIHRGGGHIYVPNTVRSAYRDSFRPGTAHMSLGFRIARTMPDSVD